MNSTILNENVQNKFNRQDRMPLNGSMILIPSRSENSTVYCFGITCIPKSEYLLIRDSGRVFVPEYHGKPEYPYSGLKG